MLLRKAFSPLLCGKKSSGKVFSPSKWCNRQPYSNLAQTLNVFDRKAKHLQKERAATGERPEVYDYLKDEVGLRLADRIFDIKRKFSKVVDLGCGRGHVSKNVISDCVENLMMCDVSNKLLDNASLPEEGVKVEKIIMDEEDFHFEPNSLDMVMSSLSLHWVNDLPGTFMKVKEALKDDGAFLGAVFGGDTLYELRSSLQMADIERLGGISIHVSPFTEVSDLGGLLNHAGFTMLTLDADEIVVNYPTMFELMWDLKGMGENNCVWRRSSHLSKESLLAAGAIYQSMYGSEDKIPATFQIIYFLGWKPGPQQPKPAKRGSATHSLKEIHSTFTSQPKKS